MEIIKITIKLEIKIFYKTQEFHNQTVIIFITNKQYYNILGIGYWM